MGGGAGPVAEGCGGGVICVRRLDPSGDMESAHEPEPAYAETQALFESGQCARFATIKAVATRKL